MAVNIVKIESDEPKNKNKVHTLKKNKGNTPTIDITKLEKNTPKG